MGKIPSLLKEVFENIFKKPATHMYPFEKPEISEGFRGRPYFVWERCVECGNCEYVCPTFAIKLKWTEGRHVPWYDMSRCCFCHACVYICPSNAILPSKDFELSTYKKYEYEGLPKVPIAPFEKVNIYKPKYINIDYSKCVECRLCADVCPTHAITMTIKDGRVVPQYDVNICVLCHKCVDICPSKAISSTTIFPEKPEKIPKELPLSPLEKSGLVRLRTITFDRKTCTGCTLCARVCPTEAIVMKEIGGRLLPVYDIRKCIFCGQCYEVCPVNAISFEPDLPLGLRRKKKQ